MKQGADGQGAFGRMRGTKRALLLLAAVCAALGVPWAARAQERVTIVGSDTMLILNNELASAFQKENPKVKVDVSGGGSSVGLRALLEGTVDLAASSRTMTMAEVEAFAQRHGGRRPWRIVVALDGLGIFVHDSNPVGQLTLEQLHGIFSGKLRNWRDLGGANRPIHVYTRDRQSGTREVLKERVLGKEEIMEEAHEVSTTALMMAAVSRSQGAIGYGGIAYSPGARIVRVVAEAGGRAHLPSAEEVAAATYPLSRPLQYYANPAKVAGGAELFLRWALSGAGQEVVKFVGYFPVTGSVLRVGGGPAPVKLTAANMKEHGLVMAVRYDQVPPGGEGQAWIESHVTVDVEFGPDGKAARDLEAVRVRVGDSVDAPLEVARDDTGLVRSARFRVRPTLVSETTILLEMKGAEAKPGTVFEARLADFESGE